MQRAPKTPVTTFLVLLNLLVFVYELVRLGMGLLGGDVPAEGFVNVGGLVPFLVTQQGEWWRVVTSGFIHLSGIHIAVNMYSLYVLGRFVESIAGSWKMALVYAISLVGSGLAVAYFSAPDIVSGGASGAIYGMFGALFAIGLKLGKPGMALMRANIGILIVNLIFTFAVPGISGWAHVGGLLLGFVATLVVFFPPRPVHATVVDANTGQELHSEIEAPDQPYR
jgi:membrane associated rhomboid family serine protease